MNLNSNKAKLRRAFAYPGDDNDGTPDAGIDSEEQEAVIARLAAQNAESNILFKYAVLAIAGMSLLWTAGISMFLRGVSAWQTALRLSSCLLSVLAAADIGVENAPRRLRMPSMDLPAILPEHVVAQARQYLLRLNGALVAILVLVVVFVDAAELWMGFPTILSYGIALYATYELARLDKEVSQLKKAKYDYRGA